MTHTVYTMMLFTNQLAYYLIHPSNLVETELNPAAMGRFDAIIVRLIHIICMTIALYRMLVRLEWIINYLLIGYMCDRTQ